MEILGLINVPLWAVLILALTALFYFYSTRQFGIFTAMGVKGPKPWPVLGNFNFRKGFVEAYNDWFQEYGRVFGIYEGAHPMLNVGDLDMLREITVKEFVNFPNRRNFGAAEVAEPPVNEFLTIMEDDTWRHNRNTLTPTFSGGKLKKMVGLIVEASQQMADVLKAKADSGEPVEMKEYTGPFTMDVIASTAFGIKINAQENHDDPFVKYARKFFDQSVLSLGLLVLFFFPFMKPVLRFFKVPISPPDSIAFFCDVVKRALEERRNNPGKYVDFVQLMINAKDEADSSVDNEPTDGATEQTGTDAGHWKDKRKGKGLTDSEISAHAIIFFAAGYDTTASTLTYLLYHLARNPDCMDRLSEEIDQHLPDGKDPDYEIVNKLPYLEMVLSEGLRINPPIARMDRLCKKETTVNGIKIPVGMTVALPIFMIHHDPGYWPDPETFDPERFTPENRATHHPLQWIPFGYGPRNCIGMRLAVLEMKIVIVKLLQKYRFVPNSKTKPLRFAESPFLSRTQDGVWLTVEHRK